MKIEQGYNENKAW